MVKNNSLRNGKKYINFEIFDRFRHRFYFPGVYYAYTLILEKDFQIDEREKNICYIKITLFNR